MIQPLGPAKISFGRKINHQPNQQTEPFCGFPLKRTLYVAIYPTVHSKELGKV